MLHSFNLVNVLLQVWIPNNGAILQDRVDEGLVGITPTTVQLQGIGQKRRFLNSINPKKKTN